MAQSFELCPQTSTGEAARRADGHHRRGIDDLDLFGVLFRALDLNNVTRLILVGDPNQLPPIGSGRPFVDIIAWLEAEDDEKFHKHYPQPFQLSFKQRTACLSRLVERGRHEDHNSQALELADGYLRDDTTPADDEMLSRVARQDVGGDLEVRYWRDIGHLEEQLAAAMKKPEAYWGRESIRSL